MAFTLWNALLTSRLLHADDCLAMAEAATTYQPHCYGLWLVTASIQAGVRGQLSEYARGIIALARAPTTGELTCKISNHLQKQLSSWH